MIVGLLGIDRGGGTYWGVQVKFWAYCCIAIVGFLGTVWHAHAIWKEKHTPKTPEPSLDEQYAQAKAELDRLYFRKHGKMAEWPEPEKENREE